MHPTALRLAGLAADDHGRSDERPPLVLLHGLTFDHTMWRPAVAELQLVDHGRRVVAFDLPGHGESAGWASYSIETLAEGIARAVDEAHLDAPVVVGHSMAAIIATAYAGRYPCRGVVNVDQSMQVAPFADLVRSLADKLTGPAFPAVWEMFVASMHIEQLPQRAQDLLRSSSTPRQDLVLSYWSDVLARPADELESFATSVLSRVRSANVPYHVVAGEILEPDDERWLLEVIPRATVTAWPNSSHFPHLAHPDRFAECLAATAGWS